MGEAGPDRTEAKRGRIRIPDVFAEVSERIRCRQAMHHLREVQESDRGSDYRVAYYYYTKGDRRAAAAR